MGPSWGRFMVRWGAGASPHLCRGCRACSRLPCPLPLLSLSPSVLLPKTSARFPTGSAWGQDEEAGAHVTPVFPGSSLSPRNRQPAVP